MNLNEIPPDELEEIVADINAIKHSKGFKIVFEMLKQQYIDQLLQANVGDLTAASAHASMKVLADVEAGFNTFTNEYEIRKHRK